MMRWLSTVAYSVRSLFTKKQLDEQLSEEIKVHVEMATEANVAKGLARDEARYAALKEFGNVASFQQQASERRGWLWLEQAVQDFRYAIRQLNRNRRFAATIVLILALGIGACTSVFSVVDALLFRPLPVKDPAGLRSVVFTDPKVGFSHLNITTPCVREYQSGVTAFDDLVGSATVTLGLRQGEVPLTAATGELVTGNYFEALGVRPILGRGLRPDEDRDDGRNAVIVISHGCWRDLFDRAPDVIGRTVRLNNQTVTIIGVAPAGFRGLNGFLMPFFWAPSTLDRSLKAYAIYKLVGRVKPTATEVQALAQFDAITTELAAKYGRRGIPGYERYGTIPSGLRASFEPAGFGSLGDLRSGPFKIPFGRFSVFFGVAVGLVLLVACSNAASLLLVRALARRREIAVRLTLGATRARLLRQLLVESLLLAGGAGLLGLCFAHWGIAGLLSLRSGQLSYMNVDAQIDGRVLLFTAGTAVVTGLVFGLIPARQALRFDVQATLKQETPIASALHRRFAMRQLLLFTQVALGTVLLVGAGLSMRSLVELMRVDPGFDLKNVLTAMISLDREKYPEKDAQSFAQRLIERIAAMPGVRRVGFSGHMSPLSGSMAWTVVDQIEGYAAKPGEQLQLSWTGVGPGYFSLLGVPVVAGREFDHTDVLGSSRSILVNQAFVRQYWPNLEPLGRRLQDGTVVGVVADTRSLRLSEAAAPTVYTSLTQGGIGAITLLIKTEQDPSSLAPMVRRELAALDSSAWPPRFSTLQETWSDSLAPQRALLSLLGAFSGLALVLSAIGLYGFVACSVAQRTREIGIRMAVGARRHDILGLVLRQSLGLAVLGLASGIALALLAVRIIRDFLYGIGPSDPLALTGVVTVQLIVACLACWLPARRATKVDPVIALRTE